MRMTAEFQSLMDWLIGGVRSETDPKLVMAECCERLVAAGLPLWRTGVFIRTLHPEIGSAPSISISWIRRTSIPVR